MNKKSLQSVFLCVSGFLHPQTEEAFLHLLPLVNYFGSDKVDRSS